ncbi:DUF7336 domain-containing protein [Gynuella sunshinyii]|uniref:DUF7336 domain-containing protein n=1 Tax=Gynuella sunshinyii YC6258 TaxID=1445510 RepID=A0A0C5V861_9GAMM|nr:hypothetical protein [Gynuella sunshinyii]AJQ95590.1 hypothetical Protein YC6258_03554 [Gynuella sunshinyii YC6258]
MKSAYLLQHLHVISEDNECAKIIGLYASKEDALAAIKRLSVQTGFSDHPKLIDPLVDKEESGFYIDEYEIGKDHWSEGYVTV